MLWICLTAWAGLFIWYFRMRKKAEDHKLVRRIFCLAATGFIAGTALCLPIGVRKVSGDEKAELQLERGALGSQPTEEKLEVSVGNQKPERITLSVPARAYSAEEIEEAFSAAIEALDEIILGENLSFHTVNRNMDLVTEIPGSPVALSWETDRPLLIDSRGLLSDEIPEEGVEVTLKAELELQGETTEYIRKVQVYPPEIKGRDAVLRALKKAVEKENEAHLVLGGAAAVVGIVSLALELASRWKKRQSGTETGSYGKAAGIRKQGETGDVFSEYQNRKGLKQKDGTWNPKSDTEQQGWKRDSSVEKEKTWEKNEEQENRKMHSLMELEGHEEDLFGKTELLTSPEDEGRAYLIPIDPIDLPLIPIERGSTLIGKLSAAADVILPYRTVSRLHAKLVSTEEGDYLLDLNSRNGTTVNGVPLMGETKKKLEDGDDISFAGKKYRYKAGEKNRN